MTMKVILVCTCSGMKEKAEMAFKIMLPNEELPQIYKGKDAILKFSDAHRDTNVGNYTKAISKQNGKFAYLVEFDEKGDVISIHNLATGKKVA